MNNLSLVGRVGADPEIKYFESGRAKTTFTLATDRKVGQDKKTDWHRVELWGKPAESAAEHIRKGDVIGVTGSLEYNQYETSDGQKRKDAIVAAQRWNFCGGGKKDQQAGESGDHPAVAPDGEEIPF